MTTPKANEVYSPQTRQTRTALGVSTGSLLIYCFFGSPNSTITLPTGAMTIPDWSLAIILIVTVAYFLGSFLLSAVSDNAEERPKSGFEDLRKGLWHLRDTLPKLDDCYNELFGGLKIARKYAPALNDEKVAEHVRQAEAGLKFTAALRGMADTKFKETENYIEKLERRLKGLSVAKHTYWDFWLPVIIAGAALLLSVPKLFDPQFTYATYIIEWIH